MLSDYVALVKPRIIFLIILVSVASMVSSPDQIPSIPKFIALLISASLSVAGASALNDVLDLERDVKMGMYRGRPLVTKRVTVRHATIFGCTLTGVSLLFSAWSLNLTVTLMIALGFVIHITFYSWLLKPRTAMNIFVDALIAFPATIGGAAASGPPLSAQAITLGALVYLWIVIHVLCIFTKFAADYQKAGIPTLPTIFGAPNTGRIVFASILLLLGFGIYAGFAGILGDFFLVSTVVLGIYLALSTRDLLKEPSGENAWKCFRASNHFLTLLVLSIFIEAFLG